MPRFIMSKPNDKSPMLLSLFTAPLDSIRSRLALQTEIIANRLKPIKLIEPYIYGFLAFAEYSS